MRGGRSARERRGVALAVRVSAALGSARARRDADPSRALARVLATSASDALKLNPGPERPRPGSFPECETPAVMLDTSLPVPAYGRTYSARRRVRLSDMDAYGRLRLDAVAR